MSFTVCVLRRREPRIPKHYGWAASSSARRSDEIQAKLAKTLDGEVPASDTGFERFNIATDARGAGVGDEQRRAARRAAALGLCAALGEGLKTRSRR